MGIFLFFSVPRMSLLCVCDMKKIKTLTDHFIRYSMFEFLTYLNLNGLHVERKRVTFLSYEKFITRAFAELSFTFFFFLFIFFFVICCTYNSMRYTHDVHLFFSLFCFLYLSPSACSYLSLFSLPLFFLPISFFLVFLRYFPTCSNAISKQ